MQIKMINANGSVWVVKREFPIDSWFSKVVDEFGAEEVCKGYCVEKVLRSNDGKFYLVNEVSEAQIIED